MSMRESRGREAPGEAEREGGSPRGPEGGDRSAAAERRAEAAERLSRAEAADTAREAKERIADVLWEKPAAFAEYAAAGGLGGKLAGFLEAFSKLGDDVLATEKLRAAREAAAKSSREGESA